MSKAKKKEGISAAEQPGIDTPPVAEQGEGGEATTAQSVPEGILLTPEDMEKVNKALAEREEYLLAAQRITADFDNYRKRTNAVRAEAMDDGIREAVAVVLPSLDNLDRAMAAMAGADENLLKGVEMVKRGLLIDLEKIGVEEVPALGEVFDPELHEAVMRSEAAEGEEDGQIVEVFTKGYRARGKVIRYALVRVAQQ